MRYGKDILRGLCDPGRKKVIFVDDGGTPGKPVPLLAADFVVMCGVSMTAEGYRAAKTRLRSALASLGPTLEEFHATQIVNPTRKSAWKKVPVEERIGALSVLTDILVENADAVLFCYVSGEQYYSHLQSEIVAQGGQKLDHKSALKKVFFNELPRYLHAVDYPEGEDVAIVVDSQEPLGYEKIRLQRIRTPQGFYEGCVIHADSRVEAGLQLADFAAYTINRIHHVHQRRIDGKLGRFEDVMEEAFQKIQPKLVDLLLMGSRMRAHG